MDVQSLGEHCETCSPRLPQLGASSLSADPLSCPFIPNSVQSLDWLGRQGRHEGQFSRDLPFVLWEAIVSSSGIQECSLFDQ